MYNEKNLSFSALFALCLVSDICGRNVDLRETHKEQSIADYSLFYYSTDDEEESENQTITEQSETEQNQHVDVNRLNIGDEIRLRNPIIIDLTDLNLFTIHNLPDLENRNHENRNLENRNSALDQRMRRQRQDAESEAWLGARFINSDYDLTTRAENGQNILHYLVKHGTVEQLNRLFQDHPDEFLNALNNVSDMGGWTPLHLAAKYNTEIYFWFLSIGANREVYDVYGRTPQSVFDYFNPQGHRNTNN